MEKRLYIGEDKLGFLRKSKEQTGEHQGGTYVARVQTGTEKDGSPQYRYFRSQADYNEYLSRTRDAKKEGKSKPGGGKKGSKPSSKERLQTKLKEEQESSSSKTRKTPSNKLSQQHSKKTSLFSGAGGKSNTKSLSKGLYIRDNDAK